MKESSKGSEKGYTVLASRSALASNIDRLQPVHLNNAFGPRKVTYQFEKIEKVSRTQGKKNTNPTHISASNFLARLS